jgi:hypothetical protein
VGPLRGRSGFGALELALALALLAAVLAWLPPPPRRSPPETGDALARRLEHLLAEISCATSVLDPRPTAANPVSLPTTRLVIEAPGGSPRILRADSFQVRLRGPEVFLVRVRLLDAQGALFSAAEVGSWPAGSSP